MKKPYNVTVLIYPDFCDLKSLATGILVNRIKNTNGETVTWLKIVHFEKKNPYSMSYKYNYDTLLVS